MIEQQRLSLETTMTSRAQKPELIASVAHTVRLICILAVCVGVELIARRLPHHAGSGTAARRLMAGFYISMILSEWALVFGVWRGIRKRGNCLQDLIGGRWNTWQKIAVDVVLSLGLGVVCLSLLMGLSFASRSFMGERQTHVANPMLPHGSLETLLWVGLSLTAGFCEELAFRGYFQKQFQAMTGSVAVALFAQALIFGLLHIYEGIFLAIMITGFGVLFGLMAHWRRSLRPGMLAHAGWDLVAMVLLR